jgi:hypothetical protein
MTNRLCGVAFLLSALVLVLCERYLQGSVDIVIENPSGEISSVQMSRKDARQLEYFFRELIISELMAYTLAGSKPMSFACYREPGVSLSSFFLPNLKTIRGWRVWEKHCHYFDNGRLRFWREKSPWVKGVFCLIIADMNQCDEIIMQHAADFQNVVGQRIIHDKSLFQEIDKTPFLQNTLQKHDALLGILLGFGRENAWLYYEKNKNPQFAKLPLAWGPVMEQKRTDWFWKYCALQTPDVSDMLFPVFVGDLDSVESQRLRAEYSAASEKIKKFYKKRDFLSATLSLYKHGRSLLSRDA